MELVPIIYSSLLVVFSLLGIVLIFSFLYSKIFVVEKSNPRISKVVEYKKQTNKSMPISPISFGNKIDISEKKERTIKNLEGYSVSQRSVKSIPKVETYLIEKKKVRVISNSSRDRLRSERMRSDNVNSVSRYSVVNNVVKEKRVDNDLYAKFSKMSVEYSQTA